MLIVRSKTLIRTASLGLLLVSGGCLYWALAAPVAMPTQDSRSVRPANRNQPARAPEQPRNLSDAWGRVYEFHFQRPLYDPVVEAPAPKVKKVIPPPPIEVIATMPEPGGGGHAMIKDDNGRISSLAVGAMISAGGTKAKLVRIYGDHIEVEHEERLITIELKHASSGLPGT